MTMGSPLSDFGGGCLVVDRDVLLVSGDDAESFLQGQLSQEMGLAPGDSVWSFVLRPDGHIDALVRVSRLDDQRFVLDVDDGFGPTVLQRLERFKLRVRCEIETVDWRCVAVRGVTPEALDSSADVLLGTVAWPGTTGVDLLGPEVEPPPSVPRIEPLVYEQLRVACGWPSMEYELASDVIPEECGLVPIAVSFTKGCFVGQELVARIDSRGGNVPRHLRCVLSPVLQPVGSEVLVGDRIVGALTSVVAWDGGGLGLAYIHRSVEPPAGAALRSEFGESVATIHAVPLTVVAR